MLLRILLFCVFCLIWAGCGSRSGTAFTSQADSTATRSLTVAVATVSQTIEPVPAPKESSTTTGLDSSSIETSLAYSLAWVDNRGLLHHAIANKDTIPRALVRRETLMMSTQIDTTRQVVSQQVTVTAPKQTWGYRLWHSIGNVAIVLIAALILLYLFRDSFKPPDLL